MGGWITVTVFVLIVRSELIGAYKIGSTENPPTLSEEFLTLFNDGPQLTKTFIDLEEAESSKPLFNNVYWAPPIKSDVIKQEPKNSPVSNSESVSNEEKKKYTGHYHQYDELDQKALEKQAEAYVERQFGRPTYLSRTRRENNDEESPVNPNIVTTALKDQQTDDYHGESSDYIQYNDHHPKKQEIHYHQHKHLHEHEHLQEHKHQHLNEHKAVHHHEHKANAEHNHDHEEKHQHLQKAEHYHNLQADHKHEHYQEHEHDHKNDHHHDHHHKSKHEHWANHAHQHKEEAKHWHDEKGKHDHHHHHEHKANAKHHHNHWSDNKHWHDHHHDSKYEHKHKHHKVKVYYKKGHNW